MKTFNFLMVLLVTVAITSCGSQSGKRRTAQRDSVEPNRTIFVNVPFSSTLVRAKVMESNVITYVVLNDLQRVVLRPADSVFVDMVTHEINDTSRRALRCVLYNNVQTE